MNCTLTAPPESGSGTSVANGVDCIGADYCVAVGSKGSPAQPAVWWYGTLESPPPNPQH